MLLTTYVAGKLYGNVPTVAERHRHRYEVNPDLVDQIEAKGLQFVGHDHEGKRMEVLELPQDVHPFFLAVQYHPEFTSRPLRPSPPFLGESPVVFSLSSIPVSYPLTLLAAWHQASSLLPVDN
jgi:CTP synthase (UTP-ammonia lyase)